jgi:serine/threonine-protein kinase
MRLGADDLTTLSRLLDQALDLAPGQVQAWLDALPEVYSHLRPRLQEMLATHHGDGASEFLASGPSLADETVARPQDRVGPYRLIREIGQGGMGSVWLAERADGTLKRQVALKLPRLAWGSGLAERMARERDIAALLEHPNIARLYDAGVDERGRPYLALEYIDGQPLDTWCEVNALGVSDRLRLFVPVCRAVAYAHGRLVIHRDLKPSNVLVTPDGEPHLLDFGIAKLLHDAAPGGERLTNEQGRVLTPHYASPEQIRGEAIGVASDVYSLGVMLYELLTGKHPYGPRGQSLAAFEEAGLESEPALASARVDDKLTARTLRGELDAILAKTLKREPVLRYATADALAQDIERHLSGERVLAQPDSFRNRLRRSLRRHGASFVAAGTIFIAVAGGATVSVVQAKRAQEAAERARVVKEFVVDIFRVNERGSAGDKELRQLPAELLLERGAKLIETKFPGQPQLQAELYGVVGGIFADMGANALAADYATHQVEALAAIEASNAEKAKATILLAQALLADGRLTDARARAQRALALAESDAELRPAALVLLARVTRRQGDIQEARRLLDRADQDLNKVRMPTAVAAMATSIRAAFLVTANRFDEALPLYLAAIETALAAEGPLSPTAIDIRLQLQHLLIVHDRGDESRAHREAALAALRASGTVGEIRAVLKETEAISKMFSDMVPHQITFKEASEIIERNRASLAARGPLVPASIRASVDQDLGRVYATWGNLALAEPLILQSSAVLAARESLIERMELAASQGLVAMLTGRHGDANELFNELIALRKRIGEGQHPWAAEDYEKTVRNLAMQGKFDDAESLVAAAPKFGEANGAGPDSLGYALILPRAAAAVKLERGHAQEALSLMPPESMDGPPVLPFDDTVLRGEILCALGRRGEGLERLERALRALDGQVYEHHPALARARAVTGLCALSAGQRARAVALGSLAGQAFNVQPGVSPYFKAPYLKLQKELARRPAVNGDRVTPQT